MRGALLARIGLAAVACIALAWPATASSQATDQPTLTLTEECDGGDNLRLTLAGLPPNTPTTLTLQVDDEPFGTGQVVTNANGGYFFVVGVGRPATWTVTIEWAGGTLQESLHVDCSPAEPTSKRECKNGGWRSFPQFKNQGQCLAFVQRGPR